MMLHRFVPLLALVGCATADLDEGPDSGEDMDSTELSLFPPTGAYVGLGRTCLTVNQAATADGTPIVSSGCIDASNAKWSPDPATGTIRGWATKCMTASNGRLVLSTCANLTSQKWTLSSGHLKSNLGTCVSMSSAFGGQATLATCGTSPAQQIAFEQERRLRVQLVLVSDDSGGRAPLLTAQEFATNISRANGLYGPAHVQFVFDPSTDVSTVWDTSINSLQCSAADTATAIWRSQQIGARYEGRIVVLARGGSGNSGSCSSGPTGGGGNTVLIRAKFYDDQNLAHELGHYLGLDHTFILDANGNPYDTASKVRTVFMNNGSDPTVFDADRGTISDTPGDVGPQLWASVGWAKCDPAHPSFQITDTFALTPDRQNVMSYWDCPNQHLSVQQIARVRATIELPMRRTLIDVLPAPSAARMIFGYAGMCLADLNTTPVAGDMLVMTPCTDAASKTWTFGASGEIKTWNGLCLQEGSPVPLSRPTLTTCTGAANQKFGRTYDGDLKTPSGLCLADAQSNRYWRGNLVLTSCSGTDLHKFWSYLPRSTGGVN